MLHKLENSYLAILRFVVILAAGILLISFVIFGLGSFKAIKSAPEAQEFIPQVSEQELIKSINAKSTAASKINQGSNQNNQGSPAKALADPNQELYKRAATSIINFLAKRGQSLSVEDVSNIIKERAEKQDGQKLVTAYAKNLAESIEKTLVNDSVLKSSDSISPFVVVDSALDAFAKEFHNQIEKDQELKAEQERQFLTAKAEGLQSLYYAAGSFLAFLLIVFLSIIIKIERNLRPVENKPVLATQAS